MTRKSRWICSTLVLAAIPVACARFAVEGKAKAPPAPADVEIRIDNFTFTPATLTVPAGTKVTWINHDDVPHTATSTTKVFASAALDTDEKFSFVFSAQGTFPYYCAVHPHMTGQITVK